MIGEHRVKCVGCLNYFTCGDCIPSKCPECECKEHGHRAVGSICGRCGTRLPKHNWKSVWIEAGPSEPREAACYCDDCGTEQTDENRNELCKA